MQTDESQPVLEPEKNKLAKQHKAPRANTGEDKTFVSREVPKDKDDSGNSTTQVNQHSPSNTNAFQDDMSNRSRLGLKTDISVQEVQVDPLVISFASRTLRERITKDWSNNEVNKVISDLPSIRDMSDFKESLTRLKSIQEQVGEDVQSVLKVLLAVMTEVSEYPDKVDGMDIVERENHNRLVDRMLFDLRRQAIKELASVSPEKMDFFVAMAYFSHVFWSEVYFSFVEADYAQEISDEER